MQLVLTRDIDSTPRLVDNNLHTAVYGALDAAAERVARARCETATEATPHGLRVTSGLDVLDGAEIRVGGSDRLTSVQVTVPWAGADSDGQQLLAANRFASSLIEGVRAA